MNIPFSPGWFNSIIGNKKRRKLIIEIHPEIMYDENGSRYERFSSSEFFYFISLIQKYRYPDARICKG